MFRKTAIKFFNLFLFLAPALSSLFAVEMLKANTEVIAGEGMIITAGAIDCHVHFICPQLAYEAISSGEISFGKSIRVSSIKHSFGWKYF